MFDEELPRELARARRAETPLTMAVIDIDHMSAFNMLRGEQEGDRLIKECASRWRNELREVDYLARLDGTEFAIVLPAAGSARRATCSTACARRRRAGRPRRPAWRAGTARSPAELLLARGQDALAAAKAAGRNVTIAAD